MRTHDDDLSRIAVPASPSFGRQPEGALLAQRSVSSGDTAVLDPAAVSHLQRTAGNGAVSSMLDEDERSPVLDVVGSGGSPLEGRTRSEMESSFGHDFGDVRIHTDAAAAASATSVQAQAYTVGNDIVFGEGRYAPETDSGRHTLAHELAHVVQQRSGPVDGTPSAGGVAISHPLDRFEQAAEETAARVAKGGRPQIGISTARPLAASRAGNFRSAGVGTSVPVEVDTGNGVTTELSSGDTQPPRLATVATTNRSLQRVRAPTADPAVVNRNAPEVCLLDPVPGADAETIVAVHAKAANVVSALEALANETTVQASDVDWSMIFKSPIDLQIRGNTLGDIALEWTDTTNLDFDWTVLISFGIGAAKRTPRPAEQALVAWGSSGTSGTGLGYSDTNTSGFEGSIAGEASSGSGGPKVSGGGKASTSYAKSTSHSGSAGLLASKSHSTSETVSRYEADLYVDIKVSASANTDFLDILNPPKWFAAMFGGGSKRSTTKIGSLIFDRADVGGVGPP